MNQYQVHPIIPTILVYSLPWINFIKMSRKAQIQAKADFEAQNEEAWKGFDSNQARREAEIRRPARKINVMSDEEYDRLDHVTYLYSQYLTVFLRGMKLWDLRFHKEFADFFTGSFTLDSDDKKQAASEAATRISNSMSLYCQAHDDPYYVLSKMEGYNGDELRDLPNRCTIGSFGMSKFILIGILDGYLKLEGGFLSGNDAPSATIPAVEAVGSQVGSSHWLREMKQC